MKSIEVEKREVGRQDDSQARDSTTKKTFENIFIKALEIIYDFLVISILHYLWSDTIILLLDWIWVDFVIFRIINMPFWRYYVYKYSMTIFLRITLFVKYFEIIHDFLVNFDVAFLAISD